MAGTQKQTLWIDFSQSQYYLIPDDQALPAGPLRLATLGGRVLLVDPDAAAPRIVTEAAAQAHLQAEAFASLSGARNVLADLLTATVPEIEKDPAEPEPGATEPAFDPLLLLLGIPTEAFKQDPALGGLGLHNILKTLADLLADVISDDETRLAAARERVHRFRLDLEKSGIEVHPRLDELPDKIHAWYTVTDDKAAFQQIQAILQTTADRLRAAYERGETDYATLLADVLQDVQVVFAEEEETDEQRQRRYRDMARSSIEATGLPKFDFKKLWAEYNQSDHNQN